MSPSLMKIYYYSQSYNSSKLSVPCMLHLPQCKILDISILLNWVAWHAKHLYITNYVQMEQFCTQIFLHRRYTKSFRISGFGLVSFFLATFFVQHLSFNLFPPWGRTDGRSASRTSIGSCGAFQNRGRHCISISSFCLVLLFFQVFNKLKC